MHVRRVSIISLSFQFIPLWRDVTESPGFVYFLDIRLFVCVNRSRYIHNKDWASAQRVAEGHFPDCMPAVLVAQAEFCFEQRDFQRAEGLLLRADKPRLAVVYYKVARRAQLASENKQPLSSSFHSLCTCCVCSSERRDVGRRHTDL